MRSTLGAVAAVLATTYASLASAADTVVTRVHRFGDGETIVRYAQVHDGIPVLGRGALERYSSIGRRIQNDVDLAAALPSSKPSIAAPQNGHLVYWPMRDGSHRLAWAVVRHDARIITDARSGEILEARDPRVFANARVYAQNPVKTPELTSEPLALEPVSDGTGFLTNPFVESHNCIDKKSVKSLDVGIAVDVHVCDIDQVAKANRSGDFLYDPIDDGTMAARSDEFSEVAIYYHAAKAYAFFRELQGDPEAQVVEDKPLRTIANLQLPKGLFAGDLTTAKDPNEPLDTFQNAFFSPAAGGLGSVFAQLYGFDAGALWFGQGPKRDYAYDGDVVYHEFTHAVVDDSLKLVAWHVDAFGAVDAPGGMNEGLADYFSCAITGDPDVGEYASTDLGATTGVIRSLTNEDTCASVVGEVHADSTVFSGGLWDARTAMPEEDRHAFDRALYKAMLAAPGRGDLGYEGLIALFVQQLKGDLPAGATALQAAMKKRGLLGADGKGQCERILEYGSDTLTSPQPRLGFAAPGRQSVAVKNIAPGVMQIKAKVPAGATQLLVQFTVGRAASNPLGGDSKPFAPVVLLKAGAPIVWDEKSSNGHDAAVRATAKDGEATLDLPDPLDSDTVYVQIASTGDADGAYDEIELHFTKGDGAAGGNGAGADAGEASPPATQTVTTEDGCGISRRSGTFGGEGFRLGALGPVAALAWIRRKFRRRDVCLAG